jgi:hypothetical protein
MKIMNVFYGRRHTSKDTLEYQNNEGLLPAGHLILCIGAINWEVNKGF